MKQRTLFALSLTASLLGLAPALSAQLGETGRITTRSDVKMAIEGAAGTSGKKLEAMAKTLSGPLSEVKRCYAELVKEHPEVVGELTVEITLLDGKAPPKVGAPNAVGPLKPMQKCVDRAFAKLDVSEVPRPAKADVLLTLTNSAAHAVQDVKEQGEQAAHVEVKQEADGSFSSHGASLQGEVSFDVRAKPAGGKDAVERVHTAVRDALPGLFDCRRRASKKGSPEGDLVYELKLSPSAKPSVESKSSTVENERAPVCTGNVLKHALKKGGKGAVSLTIHFHP